MPDENIKMQEEAVEGLKRITGAELYELSTFTQVPKCLVDCMEAVCILLNREKPRDWRACKSILGIQNFIEELISFDWDNAVSDTAMKELEQYINKPDFRPDVIATRSWVFSALCKWVRGIYNYQLMVKSN